MTNLIDKDDLLFQMMKIWRAYSRDKANVPKPDFATAMVMVSLKEPVKVDEDDLK